jgi:hypothetical protein
VTGARREKSHRAAELCTLTSTNISPRCRAWLVDLMLSKRNAPRPISPRARPPPMRPVGADSWRRERAPATRGFSGRYRIMEISKAEGVSDGWHADEATRNTPIPRESADDSRRLSSGWSLSFRQAHHL